MFGFDVGGLPDPELQQPSRAAELLSKTWLGQLVRDAASGVGAFGEAAAGRVPVTAGMRREDLTDIPGTEQPVDPWIKKVTDAGAFAMTGGLAGAQPGAAGIFGGRLAKGADLAALKRAEEMAAGGASRDDIWKTTGWFQGADKKWRFEIDDSASKLNPNTFKANTATESPEAPIASQLWHKQLYENYPEIRETMATAKVGAESPKWNTQDSGSGFFWDRGAAAPPLINIEAPNRQAGRSVALHELQHAVQKREGFARGGSPSDRSLQPIAQEMSDRASKRFSDLDEEMRNWQYDRLVDKGIVDNDPMYHRHMGDAAREWRLKFPEKAKELDGAFTDMQLRGPRSIYERLTGEVEARNVQKRKSLTAEQRRNLAPWHTEDFPVDRQVVRGATDDTGPFSMATQAESLPMDEASRLARARAQGYDVDAPAYHGSPTFRERMEFDLNHPARTDTGYLGSGVYSTPQKWLADVYARPNTRGPKGETVSMYAKKGKYKDVVYDENYAKNLNAIADELGVKARFVEGTGPEAQAWSREFGKALQDAGYDGARGINMDGTVAEMVTFNPANLRSVNAKFDPSNDGKAMLLGSGASPVPFGLLSPRDEYR